MKVAALIQARMSSSRLPGKMLRKVREKPLLEFVLDNVSRCNNLDGVIVATSDDKTDDAIAAYCRGKNQPCFRGSLHDVAKRFVDCAYVYQLDGGVRISGDSPLIDFRLIEQAVSIFRGGDYDLVSNVFERTYPKGQSVEVVKTSVLAENYPKFESDADREHVTPFFYRHFDKFKIYSLKQSDANHSKINLCVDDEETLDRFSRILNHMAGRPSDYGWQAVTEFYETVQREKITA